ncbi:MAG TPA: proprotein convertase P-domain-containing protein [Gemmataceae bacterium]|jgi:subtilisin-like proprotein convertase family protein|nr:proprotein convertase P-domain-containing protein [Gemmataceae bacterium]
MNLPTLLGSFRRKTFANTAIRPARRRPRLDVQNLESREVPATLPAATVDPFSFRIAQDPTVGGGGSTVLGGDGSFSTFAPVIAADPTNPFLIAEAHVIYTDAARTQTNIVIQASTNGGDSWTFVDFPTHEIDTKASTGTGGIVQWTNVSNPSIAFDSFKHAYITYTETNSDHTAGRLILRKYDYSLATPTEMNIGNGSGNGLLGGTGLGSSNEHVLYKWVDAGEAYNPTVAIDTNRNTFSDPDIPAVTQTDPLANSQGTAATVKVFVAWNTQNIDYQPHPIGYNRDIIKMAISDDGGTSFGATVLMNNDRNSNNEGAGDPNHYSSPQIVFTQGRGGQAGSGGKMITAWSDYNEPVNFQRLLSDVHSFTAANIPESIEVTNNASKAITDAIDPGSNPHIPQQTLFPIDLTGKTAGVTRIDNISVTVNIHHDDLKQLMLELVAPNGASIVLFNNGTNANGDATGLGISGKNVGLVNEALPGFSGWNVGTTFEDNSEITIAGRTEPFVGVVRAEGTNTVNGLNAKFSTVPAGSIGGVWNLRVTDFRNSGNPTPTTYIRSATIHIQQNYRDAQDPDVDIGRIPAQGTTTGTGFPATSAANPAGIGPGISLATDNSLGAFSPYENRVYMAYVDRGSTVRVIFSDDGGNTWSAVAVGVGTGFLPKIAVDPTTGTLGVAYYSTTFAPTGAPVTGDAAGARVATMFTTSVNLPNFRQPPGVPSGGTPTGTMEFATPIYVNPVEQYQDQITSTTKTFEPITSNGTAMGTDGFGNTMGLVMYNGRVDLVYAGNLDEEGGFIRTQSMRTAGGPRVVYGDTGPVLSDAQTVKAITVPNVAQPAAFQPFPITNTSPTLAANTLTYNNTFFSDGRRQFNGFVVTFDRVIDPSTFTPSDITLIFRSPTDDPINGGTTIPSTDYTITPLDALNDTVNRGTQAAPVFTAIGSKRFLVKMNAGKELSGVGTYSYSVNADISDRIRNRDYQYVDRATSSTFTKTHSPGLVIPDAVGGNPGLQVTSTLNVAIAGNPVVGKVAVQVDITHTNVADLKLILQAPNGVQVTLARAGDSTGGADYIGTIFDDGGALSLASDLPPHSDPSRYRPFENLQQLRATPATGTWRLLITDNVAGDEGVLNDWKLFITPADLVITNSNGNKHDQDADGVEGEANEDIFAMPNPVANTPFALPYVSGSLPIIIPGPFVLAQQATGQPATTDNLVKNATAKSLDLKFDRVMDTSTFTPADIIRITGPLGEIPLNGTGANAITVVPISGLNGAPLANPLANSQFFRIGFPEQKLSGYYQIQLGAGIADTFGNQLDTNQNAGVGNLQGAAVGAPVDVTTFDKGSFSTALPANGIVTTIPLDVNQAFLIQRATVTVSILLNGPAPTANTQDLDIQLIAPDGKAVLLATDAPASGATNSMINTTFDDSSKTPVQLGGPFDNASFDPVQPLAQLINHATVQGTNKTWKLVIKNKGTVPGTISKFVLNFDKSRAGTGLGEVISDQLSLSFRIFQTDGSTDTARGNWTPIGPAGQFPGSQSTAGRVQAVAVDPSDASGNTVYAAGASGGVWRTTNFLTRDVDGPTWIPLTDFGSTNAINVGALALYPDPNGNPQNTTIFVGTGSQDANRIQALEMRGTEDMRFDGVGFLMSEDAGKTWQILDSLDNYDTTTNTYRKIDDPVRDHRFIGAVVNKIVYEQNKNAFSPFRPIIYAVIGQGTATAANVAGLYRSLDGGRTWKQLFVGTVDDFEVAQGSQLPNSGNRPTIAYMGVEGDGMYRTVQLNASTPAFTKMLGGVGRPTVNAEAGGVPTDAPQSDPNGNKSKIVIGVPFFSTKIVTDPNTGTPTVVQADPLANNYYQRWVYAAVSNTDGTLDALYMSKDAGDNWTRVFAPLPTDPPFFFTDHGGTHSLAVSVDPTNPNIVYLASDMLVRIDTTFINDPYNFSLYQHSNADGGLIRVATTGGAQVNDRTLDDGVNPEANSGLTNVPGEAPLSPDDSSADQFNLDPVTGLPLDSLTPLSYAQELDGVIQSDPRKKWNFLNLVRGPYNPFRTDTPLEVANVTKFTNTGDDVVALGVVEGPPRDYEWIANMVTFVDPLTGKARVVYGSDEGITSFVAEGDGTLNRVNTFYQPPANGPSGTPDFVMYTGTDSQVIYDRGLAATVMPDGSSATKTSVPNSNIQVNAKRNGNLQVARFYSGDSQPSLLAASIAHTLALGAARRLNDVVSSSEDVIQTGDNVWSYLGRNGRANYVVADQTGTGAIYILTMGGSESLDPEIPLPALPVNPANMFQVALQGLTPISRTQGLFDKGFAQWDQSVRRFAVNPIDPDGIILGSRTGNLYRTTDQGLTWFDIGDTEDFQNQGVLDGTYTSAMAFAAPELDTTSLNDSILVGTKGGHIFWTKTGGGTNAPGQPINWFDISAGILPGEIIEKIQPNPSRGTHEAYAVTDKNVYWIQDWTAAAGTPAATWQVLTNNIPTIQELGFGHSDWSSNLVGLGLQTPQLMTIAVDWRPTYSPTPALPVLYVGGDAGVFRSTRNPTDPTKTQWIRYPAVGANKASSEGGGLPVVKVTDLDLATGNVDPNSGRVIPAGSPDMLLATTLGRGSWSINLGKPDGVSGPRVISATPNTPQTTPVTKITVTFDQYIDPTSFTTSDVTVTDPNGNPVTVLQVNDVTPIVVGTANLHNVWDIVFDTPGLPDTRLAAEGTYKIVVGPGVLDGGGTPMDQNGNGINGEPSVDSFKMDLVVGRNDVTDYILDSYLKLLGRLPTTAEYTAKNPTAIETTRYTALQTVVKELLATYNTNEARQRLVERLFAIAAPPAGEVGNLLPAPYVLTTAERDSLVADLVNGKKSPETIMIYIMSKPEYFTQAGGTAVGFLTKMYTDLFKGTTVTFASLPPATQSTQTTQAGTTSGRLALLKSIIGGAVVTYDHDSNPATPMITTDFRSNEVTLAYKQLVGRAATAAEITAGKKLIAKPLAAKSIQGLEWVYWKIMTSKEFFSLQTQNEPGVSPDDGLHTDRSWVNGVINGRFFRTVDTDADGWLSTIIERDTYSQKALDLFKTQRTTFEKALVGGDEYRKLQITFYYKFVFGVGRIVTDPEMKTWLANLKAGKTYANLVSTLLGSAEYYQLKTGSTTPTAALNVTWAKAVYQTLLNRASTGAEETALVNQIPAKGRTGAALSVLNSTDHTNGDTWRDILIKADFTLLLNRAPNAAELTAYETYLSKNRWEYALVDIMATGAAIIESPTIPRQFWEIAN